MSNAGQREKKITELMDLLREEIQAQPHMIDERFSGVVTFRFDLRNGGIIGNVRVEKDGRIVRV